MEIVLPLMVVALAIGAYGYTLGRFNGPYVGGAISLLVIVLVALLFVGRLIER